MRSVTDAKLLWFAVIAVTVVLIPAILSTALADEPMLAIRQVGGGSSIYAVTSIEQIYFADDALVVVGSGGTDTYPATEITRIEFLWDFSSVETPEDAAALLKAVHLFQNQPNPFSPETRIEYELPRPGHVKLDIFGASGRLIRTLVDKDLAAGKHNTRWDGRDPEGRTVAGGIYFYSLDAPGIEESRQMILLR